MKTQEEYITEETITFDMLKPVSLRVASETLKEKFPHFYFSETQLRCMCIKRLVPHIEMPTCGMRRKVRYMVRIREIVNHFKKHYKPA